MKTSRLSTLHNRKKKNTHSSCRLRGELLEQRDLLSGLEVTLFSPGNSAVGVAVAAKVSATFNEAIDSASLTSSTFQLRDSANTLVPSRISYNDFNHTATLDASTPLSYFSNYTITVQGGSSGVKDLAGNPLSSSLSWSFVTAAAPETGTGGPILIVTSPSNPFSSYYTEILRAEGMNEFSTANIASVNATVLDSYQEVILGEMSLTSSQATMFSNWVQSGGNLIAMRPDSDLASLLGISPLGTTLSNAYLQLNTASGPGVGLTDQTIQFHGAADAYSLNGATSVATLYSNATQATTSPAVTLRSVGNQGGQAAAFAYDLAKSIVYTRQGNPAWSGQERDGVVVIRSDDLFYGNAANDPQPNWIDLSKAAIPQADEQQRLLANMMTEMMADEMPLPRLWYFPDGAKAVVMMTGDDHGNKGTAGRFDTYLSDGTSGSQPIRSTSYIYTGSVTDSQAAQYAADGFEIALHVSLYDDLGNERNWTSYADLDSAYTTQLGTFQITYPSLPTPATERTHAIVWSDYDSQPQVEFDHRIRLDTNYYYYPPSWVQDQPGMMTGSGMIMRFTKADGTMIDVYQAATQITDESGQSEPQTINALLDNALGSLGYYGVFTANMHTDTNPSPDSEDIILSAKARGVPVMSAEKLLDWTDGRNGSSFNALSWNTNGVLNFSLTVAGETSGLKAMLPYDEGNRTLCQLTCNGSLVPFTVQTIKGITYAFFNGAAGDYVAQYANDAPTTYLDTTAADFSAGTPGTNTLVISQVNPLNNGGVSLAPAAGSEFFGTALPTGWTSTTWNTGGTATVSDGLLRVDGVRAYTTATFSAGHSVEFMATFTGNAFQHVGFGVDFNTQPWAIFSTSSGGGLYVRTNNGTSNLNTAISSSLLNSPHLFRIDWNSANVVYSVDGTVVATHTVAISTAMRPIVSDFNTGGGNLQVDWLRMGPFAASGSFTSRVFDGGASVTWETASWTATTPTGTGVAILVRSGNTPTPDGTWTNFVSLASSGAAIGVTARYLQYRADLTTNSPANPDLMPTLNDVSITFIPASAATLGNSGPVAEGSPVTVSFTISNDPGNLHYSFALTQAGLAANYAAAGTSKSTSFTFNDNGNFTVFSRVFNPDNSFTEYNTVVTVTNVAPTATLGNNGPVNVNAPVTVSFSNPADVSSPDVTAGFHYSFALTASGLAASYTAAGTSASQTFTFTTSGSFTVFGRIYDKDNGFTDYTTSVTVNGAMALSDTTVADFSTGTPGANTSIISQINPLNNGAVSLTPTAGSEFTGTALPSGWTSTTWNTGGTATVSGGVLSVNGVRAYTTATYGVGRSVEFRATFTGDSYQHVGFGVDFNAQPWAIFSTSSGGGLYVRTNNGASDLSTALSSSFLNSMHLFRIDWNSDNVVYSVDGTVVATHTVAISTAMRPIVSDYSTSGGNLQVDWLRMGPFAASGSFTSRVFDGGASVAWSTASWTATTPSSTSAAIFVRTGNTPTPDGTWTNFVPLASSGASIGVTSRYLQYRVDLTTNSPANPDLLPVLNDITFTYSLAALL
jgi:hypothetical protein